MDVTDRKYLARHVASSVLGLDESLKGTNLPNDFALNFDETRVATMHKRRFWHACELAVVKQVSGNFAHSLLRRIHALPQARAILSTNMPSGVLWRESFFVLGLEDGMDPLLQGISEKVRGPSAILGEPWSDSVEHGCKDYAESLLQARGARHHRMLEKPDVLAPICLVNDEVLQLYRIRLQVTTFHVVIIHQAAGFEFDALVEQPHAAVFDRLQARPLGAHLPLDILPRVPREHAQLDDRLCTHLGPRVISVRTGRCQSKKHWLIFDALSTRGQTMYTPNTWALHLGTSAHHAPTLTDES
mmetsp:Transcript_38683/g.102792  ORF Transcript_38683/g.102792 Transcript_38683/m.102792 type:complete len:301 (-) Transcript_38683:25-927(-)